MKRDRLRPILKWAGGKTGVLDQLLPHFPENFSRYIEPFFGGGAVYFSFPDSEKPAVLNDLNTELISVYEVVRDHPTLLMQSLDEMTQHYSEEYYYLLRSSKFDDPIQCASRLIFLNKTGFNGLYRTNSKGEFNVPFGKRAFCPQLYERENLMRISERLKRAKLCSVDFELLLDECGEGDLVYCDPPYQPISTSSSFRSYTAKGFTKEDHLRLRDSAQRARTRGAKVFISNSSSPYIEEIYSGVTLVRVSARRAINSKGNLRGKVQEVLAVF